MGLIPRWGRSPGEGHSNPLQYSYLENPMVRGAWQATVLRVPKSRTRLKQFSMHTLTVIWKYSNHFNFVGCNLNWEGCWSIIPHNASSEPYLGPLYSWSSNNRGLNCASPFIGIFFFSTVNTTGLPNLWLVESEDEKLSRWSNWVWRVNYKLYLCFPGDASGKESAQCRRHKRSLGRGDPLEKEMAVYSSIPAWIIP